MNKLLYIVIGCVGGAAIGGGIAYIYLNKKYDVVFEKETESYRAEISELRSNYDDLQKNTARKLYKTKEEFFDNDKFASVDPDDIVEDSEDEENIDVEPTNKTTDIRFITKKDYEDDEDYEKEEIVFYMADGVITQDEDILEEDEFFEVCGDRVLSLLREDKSLSRWSAAGDNELYIRNEGYSTDYKIKRYHKAYHN